MQRLGRPLPLLVAVGCLCGQPAGAAQVGAHGFPSHNQTARPSIVALHAKALEQQPFPYDPALKASNYKKETTLFCVTAERIFAVLFCALVASVPVVLVILVGPKGGLTKAHKIESGVLMAWLLGVIFMFTQFLTFNSGSGHWEGARPLTIVEAVYLLSQILTTVGYGDITPAQPVAQVLVAFNVILALCLYGSLIMETVDLAGQRLAQALEGEPSSTGEGGPTPRSKAKEFANTRLTKWSNTRTLTVDFTSMRQSGLAFLVFVTIGVLFWHYFPGEEKTWLQAVYMSVITLSTVGFGAFTATTPGGMVFGAFWMLFGVAALGAFISAFVEVMFQTKAMERESPDHAKLKFFDYVEECSHRVQALAGSHEDDMGMDQYEFLKFGLLLTNKATEEEIKNIEARFAHLSPDAAGNISIEQLLQGGEAPPTYAKQQLAAGK